MRGYGWKGRPRIPLRSSRLRLPFQFSWMRGSSREAWRVTWQRQAALGLAAMHVRWISEAQSAIRSPRGGGLRLRLIRPLLYAVMVGLVLAIHVLLFAPVKTWIHGTT